MNTVIVDYACGNVASLANALAALGASPRLSRDPGEIARADRLLLPGVGAFPRGMTQLTALGLVSPLEDAVLGKGTPILGICLGMQLFAEYGVEVEHRNGLGWLPGVVELLRVPGGLRLPHIGWNDVCPVGEDALFAGLGPAPNFYFVHSYHLHCREGAHVVAWCEHGQPFAAAVRKDNIMGVQFHPEKSHRKGLQLLANFLFETPLSEREATVSRLLSNALSDDRLTRRG